MKKFKLGNINTAVKTNVISYENFSKGYTTQVSGSAMSGTVTIKVYEACGPVADNAEMTNANPMEWSEIATGTVTASESFFLNRENFGGKYIYILVDASAGTLNDAVVYFNPD